MPTFKKLTNMRPVLISGLTACLLSCLLPFGNAATAETVLNFSWPQNAGPLDPHDYGANQMYAQAMVYEGLVRYSETGEIQPWLATSWQVSDDGLEWVFHLKDGVLFSNGESFDAAAVAANFDIILKNAAQHDWLDLISQLDSVSATDPLTVKFVLRNPYYPLLQELALARPVRFLAPSQISSESGRMIAPVGTGPWILSDSVPGEYDLFSRNVNYWGTPPAYDSILVKIITDPTSRAIALETGEIDLIYGAEGPVSPDTFARYQAMGGWQTAISGPMETRMLALNSAKGPTAEIAVRRAINHAVNKDLLIASVLHDLQVRADTLFPPGIPYADLGLKPYDWDPARAETLLDEAGWHRPTPGALREKDGLPLQTDLVFIGSDANMKAMAEVIQADLRGIGIDLQLVGAEPASFYDRQTKGDFGLIFNDSWGAPYDPHAFVGAMRAPAHADYQAQLGLADKPGLDAKITEVLITTDETRRQTLYREILTTLHDEAIYLPLTNATAVLIAKPGIGNTGFGATSYDIPFGQFTPPDAPSNAP